MGCGRRTTRFVTPSEALKREKEYECGVVIAATGAPDHTR